MNAKHFITAAVAFAALALPSAASAACNAGVANDLTVVPPASLAEGQTQQQNFTVTACTTMDHVSVEWVKIIQSNQPWMGKFDSANRTSVVTEATQPVTTSLNAATGVYTHTGATTFTVPVGLADGHYAVITRYYARGVIEAQGGSSFSIQTPDVCSNIDGKQQTLPTSPSGLVIDSAGNCTVPPTPVTPLPPIVIADLCINLAGAQDPIPTGYTLVDGECKIIAKPTGETPTPLLPAPWITKTANVKTTKTGGIIRYTITAGNRGPGTLIAARTCDKLPAGTTYVSSTGNAAFTNGSLCIAHGNMAAGKTVHFTITVKVSGSFHGKTVKNTACVTSSNAAKKCATAIVKVKVIRREPVGGVTG